MNEAVSQSPVAVLHFDWEPGQAQGELGLETAMVALVATTLPALTDSRIDHGLGGVREVNGTRRCAPVPRRQTAWRVLCGRVLASFRRAIRCQIPLVLTPDLAVGRAWQ